MFIQNLNICKKSNKSELPRLKQDIGVWSPSWLSLLSSSSLHSGFVQDSWQIVALVNMQNGFKKFKHKKRANTHNTIYMQTIIHTVILLQLLSCNILEIQLKK